MKLAHDFAALKSLCREWRKDGLSIAPAPIMGFFHDGHASLMRQARSRADRLIASRFVNPSQFGQNKDHTPARAAGRAMRPWAVFPGRARLIDNISLAGD